MDQTERAEVADRVVLSYPSDLSERGRDAIAEDHYRGYLRRVHDELAVGDEFQEFTDVGCCGSTMYLTFRVEAIEGGRRITEDTEIAYAEREEEGAEGGWAVQNEID